MFRRGIFYFLHSLISIRPSADAAAVLIIPCLHPYARNLYTNPMAVKGFIRPQAALSIGVSSSISKISYGVETLY